MTELPNEFHQTYRVLGGHTRRPPVTEPPAVAPKASVLDVQKGAHVIYTEQSIPVCAIRVVHPMNPVAPSINHSVTVVYVPPTAGLKLHRHETEETYYVLGGQGVILLEDGDQPITVGDFIYLPSWAFHGIENTGKEMLTIMVVTAPPNG